MKQRELLVVALEVASSTAGSLTWGVAAIHSQCVALLWDSRDEADAEIIQVAARQAVGSIVMEASITLPSGIEVFGAFLRPAENLDEFTETLRVAYLAAIESAADTPRNI
ncbi:MAG: hypothetical protein ACO1RT_09255 [Planctomycetaceae bacterium]